MKKVAVIGPGLLGGSIALGLRKRSDAQVAIWARRQESVKEALEGGFCDMASVELGAVVRGADVVVLCTPVDSMGELGREMVPLVGRHTLVTDVGSVKGAVHAALDPCFAGRARFVGSHPMAGSEQTGMRAAKAGLFEGAACIVTPGVGCEEATVAEAGAFWELLGCRVHRMGAQEHDRAVAWISHFPHLLAAVLVRTVSENDPGALELCGPGFRDTTRVAGGAPGMWAGILGANREAVRESAEAMVEKLREIIKLLGPDSPTPSMEQFLTLAKAERDRLRLP